MLADKRKNGHEAANNFFSHLPKRLKKVLYGGRLRLKRDGTRAETRFRLSAKRTT